MIYRRYGKRIFDLILAFVGLIALSLPMIAIAVWILARSGPPALFRQTRIGRNAEPFECYKFRTMDTCTGLRTMVTINHDPRITPQGRIMRQYKLDELPQLINIIKGDMSFVGPRPDVSGYADQLEGEDRLILELRPGITGPATLAYRDEETVLAKVSDFEKYNDEVIYPHKVQLNRAYYADVSLWLDLRLLVRTLLTR